MTKPAKMRALRDAGWRVERKRGEPTWFRDPLGFETRAFRVEEAYELHARRVRSGLHKSVENKENDR